MRRVVRVVAASHRAPIDSVILKADERRVQTGHLTSVNGTVIGVMLPDPVQVLSNRLRMRRDPKLETLLQGLDARLTLIEAPFDPEGGAYAPRTAHDHHAHDHDHGHDHYHDHGPRPGH